MFASQIIAFGYRWKLKMFATAIANSQFDFCFSSGLEYSFVIVRQCGLTNRHAFVSDAAPDGKS